MSAPVHARIARWAAVGLAVLIALGLAGAFLGASFAARQVLTTYLDDIGASYQGLDTVRLNILQGSASAGPLTVGGDSPAKLRRAHVSVSLGGLLRGRALITTLRIEGLEVDARRDATGSLTLGGLPFRGLIGEAKDRAAADVGAEQWLMGVMDAALVDSRLRFTDLNGGEIDVDVARFEVDRLLAWEPDVPTAFTLDAALNGMPVRYRGTIAPLAEPVTIDLNGAVEQIAYEPIARFAGDLPSLGLAGMLAGSGSHRIALFADGRLEGASSAEITLQDLGLTTPDGETATSERVRVAFELDHHVDANREVALAGDLTLEVSPSRLSNALGEEVALAGATAEASALSVRDIPGPASAGLIDRLATRLDIETTDGDRRLSLSELIVRAIEELAEEILNLDLAISTGLSISVEGLSAVARDGVGEEVFRSEVARLFGASQDLSAERRGEEWHLDADLTAGAEGYESRASVAGEVLRSRVASLSIVSEALSARTAGEDTRVTFDLDASLSGSVNESGGGNRLAVATIRASSPGLDVAGRADLTGETRGPLRLEVEDVVGAVPLAERTLDLVGRSLSVDLERLMVEHRQQVRANLAGGLSMADWSVDEASTPLEAGFAALDLVLPGTVITVGRDGVTTGPEQTLAMEHPGRQSDPNAEPARSDDDVDPALSGGPGAEPMIRPSPPRPPLPRADPSSERAAAPALVPPPEVPIPVLRPSDLASPAETNLDGRPTAPGSAERTAAADASQKALGIALGGFAANLPTGAGVLSLAGERTDFQLGVFDVKSLSSEARLDGRLDFEGWRVEDPATGIAGRFGSARIDANDLRVDFGADPPGLSGGFAAAIEAARAEGLAAGERQWAFSADTMSAQAAEAGLSGPAATGRGRVEIAGGRIEQIGGDDANWLGAERITIGDLALGSDRLGVGVVSLAGLDLAISGHLLEVLMFTGEGSKDEPVPQAESDASSPPPIRIEMIDVPTGADILWTDEIADRRLSLRVTMDPARVGPVDLTDPSQTTEFDLRMTTERGAHVAVTGAARLAADPPDFDLSAQLTDVQLAHASPYAETAVGFALESGLLSSTLDARASSGALDGMLEVMLSDFRFSPAYPGAAEAFAEDFVVSPAYAVNTLRGEGGRIDLKFPISGTLDDPDIDLSALMTKATGGVMVSLLPFNWFSDDEWEVPQVVIQFAPGSVDLVGGFEPLLAEVGQILVNDSQTPVALCGVATLADVPARPELTTGGPTPEEMTVALRLASSRESAVRAYLVAEAGVPADRLTPCEASFRDAPAVPGTLFSVVERP